MNSSVAAAAVSGDCQRFPRAAAPQLLETARDSFQENSRRIPETALGSFAREHARTWPRPSASLC